MNVHFVETGDYITESRYPSFDEPSQYYPFLGYSAFLFSCGKIASLFNIDWSLVVKFAQFFFYLISVFLVRNIACRLTNRNSLGYIIGICYLLYYPYFNFTNLVMSETYAVFLAVLTTWLFVKNQTEFNAPGTLFMFLLAGYSILVKPVFAPIVVAITALFVIKSIKNARYVFLLCILAVFIFPISQSIFSKVYYDNYKIQTGFGWHMWDRVIYSDKLFPNSSENLDLLESIFAEHNRTVPYGKWWVVTKHLSEFGYNESETQEICRKVALDGIRERPQTYFFNTFKNSYTNFVGATKSRNTHKELAEYYMTIEEFSDEPQHVPLTDQLAKQTYYNSYFLNSSIIRGNYKISKLTDHFNFLIHNSAVLILFVIAGLFNIYVMLASKLEKNTSEFIIWFVGFAIIFGSNIAEYPQPRLKLPAVIFIVMSIAIYLDHLRMKFNVLKDRV